MKTKFIGEPNQTVTVNMDRIILNFDEKGEMLLSADHPALERMKTHFQYEDITAAPAAVAEPDLDKSSEEEPKAEEDKFVCPHCGFEAASKSGLTAHIRAKHKE